MVLSQKKFFYALSIFACLNFFTELRAPTTQIVRKGIDAVGMLIKQGFPAEVVTKIPEQALLTLVETVEKESPEQQQRFWDLLKSISQLPGKGLTLTLSFIKYAISEGGVPFASNAIAQYLAPQNQQWISPTLSIVGEAGAQFLWAYITGKPQTSFYNRIFTLAERRPVIVNTVLKLLEKYFGPERSSPEKLMTEEAYEEEVRRTEKFNNAIKWVTPMLYIAGPLTIQFIKWKFGNEQVATGEQASFDCLSRIWNIVSQNSTVIGYSVASAFGYDFQWLLSLLSSSSLPELPLDPNRIKAIEQYTIAPDILFINKVAYLTNFDRDELEEAIPKAATNYVNSIKTKEKRTEEDKKLDAQAFVDLIFEGQKAINEIGDEVYALFTGEKPPHLSEKTFEEMFKGGFSPEEIPGQVASTKHPWSYIVPSAKSVFGVPLQNQI